MLIAHSDDRLLNLPRMSGPLGRGFQKRVKAGVGLIYELRYVRRHLEKHLMLVVHSYMYTVQSSLISRQILNVLLMYRKVIIIVSHEDLSN